MFKNGPIEAVVHKKTPLLKKSANQAVDFLKSDIKKAPKSNSNDNRLFLNTLKTKQSNLKKSEVPFESLSRKIKSLISPEKSTRIRKTNISMFDSKFSRPTERTFNQKLGSPPPKRFFKKMANDKNFPNSNFCPILTSEKQVHCSKVLKSETTIDPFVEKSGVLEVENKFSKIENPPISQCEVQMTASFNVLSSEVFSDYQIEIRSALEKIQKVFKTGLKSYNKQQLAFILNSIGFTGELDDDFNGRSPEDAFTINHFFNSLREKDGKIESETLRKVLSLIHGLIKNNFFKKTNIHQRNQETEKIKEKNVNHQTEFVLSESPECLESSQTDFNVHETTKSERMNLQFRKDKTQEKEKNSISPGDGSNSENIINFEVSNQFSFKKTNESNQVIQKALVYRDFKPTPVSKIFGKPFLKECQISTKAFGRNKENQKKNSTSSFSKQENQTLDQKRETLASLSLSCVSEKNKKGSTKEISSIEKEKNDSFLKMETELSKVKGKFLFSTNIKQKNRVTNLRIYEKDDISELIKTFCQENDVEIGKCEEIIDQIENQRRSFTKNFNI